MSSFENSSIGRTRRMPYRRKFSPSYFTLDANNWDTKAVPASPKTPLWRDSLRTKSSACIYMTGLIQINSNTKSMTVRKYHGNQIHIMQVCSIFTKPQFDASMGTVTITTYNLKVYSIWNLYHSFTRSAIHLFCLKTDGQKKTW